MKKENIPVFLLFVYFILSSFLLLRMLFVYDPGEVAGRSTSLNTEVSVSIGEFRFTLYGYTSPYAQVTLSGMGIFDQTTADKNGYFIFKNRFSPFSPREACLTAQDQFGRLTAPVCLPSFPTDYNVEIGPVIMPPTLSFDKNEYWTGDEVILSGQGIPKSKVNLSFFLQKHHFFLNFLSKISLIGSVYSQTPNLTEIETDEKGNFAVNLSSSRPQKLRVFTQIDYDKKLSPESRKLTTNILPWWMIFFKIFGWFLAAVKTRLLEIIILAEIIGLAIYLLRRFLHPKNLAIVKRQGFEMVLLK